MAFADDVTLFKLKVQAMSSITFANVVASTADSIVNGSPITGAPGQPVGQYGPGYHNGEVGGALKASWQTVFDSNTVATIGTASPYAESNEDGVARPGGGPYVQRSSIGGRHSVALTVAGFGKLVTAAYAQANAMSDDT